jgi:aspartate-semialdehyde dehydrogenase
VIPEINGRKSLGERVIANPNCTTAIAAMALWPIHQKYRLRKVTCPDSHAHLNIQLELHASLTLS